MSLMVLRLYHISEIKSEYVLGELLNYSLFVFVFVVVGFFCF